MTDLDHGGMKRGEARAKVSWNRKQLRVMDGMMGDRETREEWPLLTAETEANGDSRSTYYRDPSVVGSMGLTFQTSRFFSCLGSCSWPCTKYFSIPFIFSLHCPHHPASCAGSRAALPIS
jgi:hypothetical protein